MAEWTGRKRTLISIFPAGVPPVDSASDHLAASPPAPGAISSPQMPGETPDHPSVPGHERGALPPLTSTRRPLTEYGTAQRLLRLFTPPPGARLTATDWEQGPATFEELRKVDPALTPPPRPLSGYALGIGRETAALPIDAAEALAPEAGADVAPPAPAAPAEFATASPGAAAIEAPAGAVPGDGTAVCPSRFPIKGNAQSKIYHTAASRVYGQTIAEICFATPEAAEAAGYRAPKNL
jgi:hypothetical protein